MFAYSHAMINPIIYITFNENFKKAFKRFFLCSTEEISWEHSSKFFSVFEFSRNKCDQVRAERVWK